MPKRFALGAAILCSGALLVLTGRLESKGPPVPNWSVSVSLRNLVGDGIVSDGSSCSVDQYCSGEQNVRAEILVNSEGNFVFDTNDAAAQDGGRRFVLNFGAANSILDSRYPFGSGTPFQVDTFIGTLGVNLNGSDPSLTTMAFNDVVDKRMRITWVNGKLQYNLRWDGSSGRGFVSFTCISSNGSTCSEWTASPASTAKAGLYSIPTKGKATEAYYGEYAMPFSMTLVRQ
jgi:hypothetical protein